MRLSFLGEGHPMVLLLWVKVLWRKRGVADESLQGRGRVGSDYDLPHIYV